MVVILSKDADRMAKIVDPDQTHTSGNMPSVLFWNVAKQQNNEKINLNTFANGWATSWENKFLPYANNIGAYQPVHLHSLINAIAVCFLDSITHMFAKLKLPRL